MASKPHSEPSNQPLYEFIDLEAYDVVPGPVYRELKEQLEALREAAVYAENQLRIHGTGTALIGARHRLYRALNSNPASKLEIDPFPAGDPPLSNPASRAEA